eukprot:TRINITY_DN497_c2_g1_i1.p1 TRINITY_DN497_c2_g1~~TRINITY_DN497_c2_g1_i1.p1  ORF type:complete len:433 (+),score=62.90 TRINITY_DN497_c2_g1_i1:42-1301(+)
MADNPGHMEPTPRGFTPGGFTPSSLATPVYGSVLSKRHEAPLFGTGGNGVSMTPSVHGGGMITPLMHTPGWGAGDGVTPPVMEGRRSVSVTGRSVSGYNEDLVPEETYRVISKEEMKSKRNRIGFVQKAFSRLQMVLKVAVIVLIIMSVLVGYGYITYSRAVRIPCSLVNGRFRTSELRTEMEKYGVTACNFKADMESIETEAISYLAEQYVLRGIHGMEKQALEDRLDGVFYGGREGARLSVPRAKFWVAFEEALGESEYVKVPGTGSSVGLDPPPSLLAGCVFSYTRETRIQLVYNLLTSVLVFIFWNMWPPLLAAASVYSFLQTRARRRADVSLILQAIYTELRTFGPRGTTPLNLRRLVQSRLHHTSSFPPPRVAELWPSPGFPDGPVEMALLEDETGIEYRQHNNELIIALAGY